jgi:hypothetical protein
MSIIDPKYHDGALQELPLRFYQHPMAVNKGNGQVRIIMKQPQ